MQVARFVDLPLSRWDGNWREKAVFDVSALLLARCKRNPLSVLLLELRERSLEGRVETDVLGRDKVNELYFFSVSPAIHSHVPRVRFHWANPCALIDNNCTASACARVYVLLDRIASRNENAYISSFDFAQTTVERSRQREQSGVDGPISWRLNGKAMKYKYRTPGSILSCFNVSSYFLPAFAFPPISESIRSALKKTLLPRARARAHGCVTLKWIKEGSRTIMSVESVVEHARDGDLESKRDDSTRTFDGDNADVKNIWAILKTDCFAFRVFSARYFFLFHSKNYYKLSLRATFV